MKCKKGSADKQKNQVSKGSHVICGMCLRAARWHLRAAGSSTQKLVGVHL